MSQAGPLDAESSNPQIPTSFITDDGTAIPILNELELLADVVPNAGIPFESTGVGNVVTYKIQYADESAATDATKVGLAAFDSASFDVDSNGFVSLLGGGTAATNIDVDANTGGTDPVVPNGSGNITITGAQVAAGTIGTNVLRTNSLAANSLTIEVQRSSASVGTDISLNGVCHFDTAVFGVDPNGFVTLAGGGQAIDSIAVQTGTSPIVPTVAGLVTINGAVVAAGTNPVRTDGTGANTLALEVQTSQAIAATDATKIGLCNFDSAAFDVDANGFVQLNGGGIAATSFDVQANTVPGTDPVVPSAAGVVTVNGAAVANHSVVLETRSRAANAYNVEVQYATSAAATDATKSGVAHFDSTDFTVDANGFVALAGGGAGQTITGDSGGALVPTAGNWNLLGSGSITTSGSGSTLTTQLTGLTNHAVLVGSGTSTITKLAVGATGNVLAGVTGADPAFTTTLTGLTGDNKFTMTTAVSGETRWLEVVNTSNTASSSARIQTTVAGSSAGDADFQAFITGGQGWTFGLDNSDSDAFVVSATSSSLGANNTMRISTAGEITKPLQPAFLAYLGTNDNNVTGDGTAFALGTGNALTEVFDQGSDFVTTGTFTAPITGRYMIGCNILLQQLVAGTNSVNNALVTSNATYALSNNANCFSGNNQYNMSTFADMDAGDTYVAQAVASGGTKIIDVFGGDRRTSVWGWLEC